MPDPRHTPPFKTLGAHLKYLRERLDESLAEVSGAVELHEDILERIEQGKERPSEEILMLLISHFGMQEHEALQLWELAGYDRRLTPEPLSPNVSEETWQPGKPMVMLLAVDIRTQYTDGVEVGVNKAGLVVTFTQAGGNNQAEAVAKVGMSLQQAEEVARALQGALLKVKYARPKGLPAPGDSTTTR